MGRVVSAKKSYSFHPLVQQIFTDHLLYLGSMLSPGESGTIREMHPLPSRRVHVWERSRRGKKLQCSARDSDGKIGEWVPIGEALSSGLE